MAPLRAVTSTRRALHIVLPWTLYLDVSVRRCVYFSSAATLSLHTPVGYARQSPSDSLYCIIIGRRSFVDDIITLFCLRTSFPRARGTHPFLFPSGGKNNNAVDRYRANPALLASESADGLARTRDSGPLALGVASSRRLSSLGFDTYVPLLRVISL